MGWPELGVLGALLAVACACDLAARRIPNLLVVLLAGAGVGAQLWTGGLRGAGAGVLAGAALAAVLLLPWRLGALGGGDLKLLAAAAVWVGPSRLLAFALLTGIAGLPVALAALLAHRLRRWQLVRAGAAGGPSPASPPQRPTVPLALAISLGALAALWGAP